MTYTDMAKMSDEELSGLLDSEYIREMEKKRDELRNAKTKGQSLLI